MKAVIAGLTCAGALVGAGLSYAAPAYDGRAVAILPLCKEALQLPDVMVVANTNQCVRSLHIEMGVARMYVVWLRSCAPPPSDATMRQAIDVVIAYTDAHPGALEKDFVQVAQIALRGVWPCRDKNEI
jgi:Rap1a immunity proteins